MVRHDGIIDTSFSNIEENLTNTQTILGLRGFDVDRLDISMINIYIQLNTEKTRTNTLINKFDALVQFLYDLSGGWGASVGLSEISFNNMKYN